MKAPSLYEHISGKGELLQLPLTEDLENLGKHIRAAIDGECVSASLLQTYHQTALDDPHGYRLTNRTNFVDVVSSSSLSVWIHGTLIGVAGDEPKGLVIWAFVHGLVTAELIQDGSPVLRPSTGANMVGSLTIVGAI